VEQVKEAAGVSDGKLLGVGISVQGLISDDGEEITYGMALDFAKTRREEIARYIKNKNRLEHDSYVACYRETWENRQIHNAFYISLSNSVGGSVLIDDAIYPGNTQKGGEIGHMTVVPQGGELCYCGRRGCFDTVCRAGKLDSYTDGDLEEFFRLLKEGDAKAKELWEVYLNYLVDAIHNIHMLFDCNVILGGYVGAMIGDYMDEIRRRLDEKNPFSDKAGDYLLECRYKVAASAAGAALFYIDEFFENI
jgi:predicted NBD/HSP70 family sugar kinase